MAFVLLGQFYTFQTGKRFRTFRVAFTFTFRPQKPLPYLCLFLRVFSGILAIQKEAKLRSKAGSGSCCRSAQPG